MATEEVDPRFADLDGWPLTSAMEAMWEGQLAAVAAIGQALPAITAATEAASTALGDRGRIVYVGAGTSGRVAVQDGAELMPTFAWPHERVRFIVAGGDSAFVTSIEGAEDDTDDAVNQINAAQLTPQDVVIAVAASGTTPFTVAALQAGRRARSGDDRCRQQSRHRTAGIGKVSDPDRDRTRADRRLDADESGHRAEGRAQPDLLRHHAAARPRLSRHDGEYAADQCQTEAARGNHGCADRVLRSVAGGSSLEQAEGDIKTAVLLALGIDKTEAETILMRCDGNLRRVFAQLSRDGDRYPRAKRSAPETRRLSRDDVRDGERNP